MNLSSIANRITNKLEKLSVTKIRIVEDVTGVNPYEVIEAGEAFEFQFNPTDYVLSYDNELLQVSSTSYQRRFNFVSSEHTLNLKLLLDGTDAATNTFSLAALKDFNVQDKVNKFLELSKMHDSCDGVKVEWGTLIFHGQIKSVDVSYVLFDRKGNPLRAELSIKISGSVIISEKGQSILSSLKNGIGRLAAPLAQGIGMALFAGEAIKNNTAAISSLAVAAKNGLNSIRNFDPKKELITPIKDEANEILDKFKNN